MDIQPGVVQEVLADLKTSITLSGLGNISSYELMKQQWNMGANKQHLGANKQHSGLIWAINSRDLGHSIRLFLYFN